jgi:CHC2 zinc finger
MPYSKKFIDDIRAAADIAQIVGEVIELTVYHGDRYKGLCPFHNESNPSFTVSNGLYHCFGCGEGGDAIRFIQKTQDLSFGAVVRMLAERYYITDDDTQPRRPQSPKKRVLQGIQKPIGYIAPHEPFKAVYDVYAAELFDDCYQLDHDFLLTMGIVHSDLIMELSKCLSAQSAKRPIPVKSTACLSAAKMPNETRK